MGAGKSSLVEWLRQQFDMVPFFEPNDDNPYLSDFYGDMGRWSFHSQMFFLIRRFRIHREIERQAAKSTRRGKKAPPPIVQDRTIYEDAEIFARHLHDAGRMDARDWATYQDMYQTLCAEIRPPDLMIYLRCPLKYLQRRIKRRGRSFEQKIPRKYLASLEALYEEWFEAYDLSPTLVVETGTTDYVEHLFDRLELREAIQAHL